MVTPLITTMAAVSKGLTKDDLGCVVEALTPVKHKWEVIGLQIGVRSHVLEAIKLEHSRNPGPCLLAVLKEHLSKIDPQPCWEGFVKALRSESVGETAFAEALRLKFCPIEPPPDVQSPECSTSDDVTSPVSTSASDQNQFPFLKLPAEMSEDARETLYGRLSTEHREMQWKFQRLVTTTRKGVAEKGVTPEQLSDEICCQSYESQFEKDSKKLLSDSQEEIRKSKSINDAFFIMRNYYSFFNYELIEKIITLFDLDRSHLSAFEDELRRFCERRVHEFPAKAYGTAMSTDSKLTVVLDSEFDKYTMNSLRSFRHRLGKIFKVSSAVIRLIEVYEGSVEIVFAISSSLVDQILPLSEEQEKSLRDEGVKRFEFTHPPNSFMKSEELNGLITQLENELTGARAEITGLREELACKTQQREGTQRPGERPQNELARYRIMSYQPLKGDTFFGASVFASVHRVRVNNIPCIAKRILDILVGRKGEEAVSDVEKHAIQLQFQQECIILSRMRHPNIVQFIGVCYPDQNPLDLTLIMEFLPMDLEECLQKYPNLPLPMKLSILLDVSYGLLHLHNASIIHRDLTAANVLLTHDMRAKITGLDVSKILEVHPLCMSKQSALPGALAYMPPEAMWEIPQYGAHLDIFSFGVVALFVAVQRFPQFYEVSRHGNVDVQIKKRLKLIEMLPEKGCNCLHDLICQCLQDEAGRRPTTERLNIMLKQLSQDHPRQLTDIVHLEEELAQQKQEVASLVKEKGGLKRQLSLSDAEVQKISHHVTSLQGQLAKRLEEIEQLQQEIKRLHQDHQDYLDYITAQQKSDMLNAQSDKRDILREKEQLKLELEEELAQQKQEVASLVKEKEYLKKQLSDAEVQKISHHVTSLQGQLAKRLEEIEQLQQEIKRLHQDHQDYLDYMTAQQKSDMLNAQSDKRDIMREKEQLKLELEHLKKWMQQAGFSVDPATGALPVPRKPHPLATDSVAMLPSRANQGSGPRRQQQYPPDYALSDPYYPPKDPYQQGPQIPDQTQLPSQPRQAKSKYVTTQQDSLKNLLEAGITTDIHNVAAEFGEEYEPSSLLDVPLDPNLVCPMCGLQFRIGEIQKYKHHVQNCKGSSSSDSSHPAAESPPLADSPRQSDYHSKHPDSGFMSGMHSREYSSLHKHPDSGFMSGMHSQNVSAEGDSHTHKSTK